MIVHKADPSPARQVLVGMLTSRAVLSCVAEHWTERGRFASKWENLVGEWAVQHFRAYDRAPGSAIEAHFDAWCADNDDPDVRRAIESLLLGLADEAKRLREKMKPDHLIDVASELFERVALQRVGDAVSASIASGDVEKARAAVEGYRKVEIGASAGIDVFASDADFEAALNLRRQPVVRYEDALDNFFGESLYRGAFISFMGKAKVGKSYVLQDLMWRCVDQGHNVAYFECGDSPKDDVLCRLAKRMVGRPLQALKPSGLPVRYDVPIAMDVLGGSELPKLEVERRRHDRDVTIEEERAARHAYGERFGWDKLKVSNHPANSLSVRGIETILERWGRDGWRADAIVIDYADILAPMSKNFDKRDQVGETWTGLRALSQKWHALTVTATQTDADSTEEWLLNRKNFSESIRKYDHVTGMVGINQTNKEKDCGLYRLNWVVPYRESDEMTESKYVWCAGCLSIGRPFMLSSFPPNNDERPRDAADGTANRRPARKRA